MSIEIYKFVSIGNGNGNKDIEWMEQCFVVVFNVDVYENVDEFLVIVDMFGVVQDQMGIYFEKGCFIIEGCCVCLMQKWILCFIESEFYDYCCMFLILQGIDFEKIVVELLQGVFIVYLFKYVSVCFCCIEVKVNQLMVFCG